MYPTSGHYPASSNPPTSSAMHSVAANLRPFGDFDILPGLSFGQVAPEHRHPPRPDGPASVDHDSLRSHRLPPPQSLVAGAAPWAPEPGQLRVQENARYHHMPPAHPQDGPVRHDPSSPAPSPSHFPPTSASYFGNPQYRPLQTQLTPDSSQSLTQPPPQLPQQLPPPPPPPPQTHRQPPPPPHPHPHPHPPPPPPSPPPCENPLDPSVPHTSRQSEFPPHAAIAPTGHQRHPSSDAGLHPTAPVPIPHKMPPPPVSRSLGSSAIQSRSVPLRNDLVFSTAGIPNLIGQKRAHALAGISFNLKMRQQPHAARACGFGDRDRRVIDPPPIVQLVIESPHMAPEEIRAYLCYESYVMSCLIYDESGTRDASYMPDEYQSQRRLMGSLISTPFVGQDENHVEGCFFCFSDLSCRTPGTFRLRFTLIMIDPSRAGPVKRFPILAVTMTEPFKVYNAKEFPGMVASSRLAKRLKEQGCIISIKKGNEKNERGDRQDDNDDSEDNEPPEPQARDARPERNGRHERSDRHAGHDRHHERHERHEGHQRHDRNDRHDRHDRHDRRERHQRHERTEGRGERRERHERSERRDRQERSHRHERPKAPRPQEDPSESNGNGEGSSSAAARRSALLSGGSLY